jgi:hypothetical protein
MRWRLEAGSLKILGQSELRQSTVTPFSQLKMPKIDLKFLKNRPQGSISHTFFTMENWVWQFSAEIFPREKCP